MNDGKKIKMNTLRMWDGIQKKENVLWIVNVIEGEFHKLVVWI